MSALPNQDADNIVSELPQPKGPGARLKTAREARQLEIKDAAQALYIREDQLIALEADDFEHLPARVFILGYLKKYARLVGIPQEAIVKAFNEYCPPNPEDAHMHRLGADIEGVRESGVNAKKSRFSLKLLLLVVIVGAFYAWSEGYINLSGVLPDTVKAPDTAETQLPAPVAEQQPVVEVPANEQTLVTEAVAVLPLQPVAQTPSAEAKNETAVVAETAAAVSEPVAEETAEVFEVPVVEETVEAVNQAVTLLPTPQIVALPAVVAEPQPVVVAAAPEIIVSFSELCWVDIRDSAKTFKYMAQAKPGTVKKITGTPPYKMLFGNVNGVSMTINGEPFDLQRYNNANVARFDLDPADL